MRVDDGSSEVLPKVTALVVLESVIWEMAQEAGKGPDFQSGPTPPAPLIGKFLFELFLSISVRPYF